MAPVPVSSTPFGSRDILTRHSLSDAATESLHLHSLLRRAKPVNPNWDPSAGSKSPQTFNNKGFFALFALLGAAMVVASIWFFFWAKNGGFHWRKGDWDDYKSTVLRRKGPDGKTLSNATPRTDLGQKSIAGTFDNHGPQMTEVKDFGHREPAPQRQHHRHHHHRHHHAHQDRDHSEESVDDAVKAYRHEKAARVGGLNCEHDGSHFGFSSTEGSEVMTNDSRTHLRPRAASPKKKGFMERKREKKNDKKVEKTQKKTKATEKRSANHTPRRPAERRPSLSTAADSLDSSNDATNNYYSNYRPPVQPFADRRESPRRHSAPRHSQAGVPQRSGRASPKKQTIYNRTPGSFDVQSEAGSSDLGTKSYSHHIPELARGSRDTGFRRGQTGRRRDSLSDSD
ncbi:MAG: hypothetical protein M1828_000248 [Chrysothrix sp. TS-e1954]|nr:MAG: hypothetical protein M1828_000248 [Chrysothrix sp. TS-e1954]